MGEGKVPEMATRLASRTPVVRAGGRPLNRRQRGKGGTGRWVGGEAGSGKISCPQAHILSLKGGLASSAEN